MRTNARTRSASVGLQACAIWALGVASFTAGSALLLLHWSWSAIELAQSPAYLLMLYLLDRSVRGAAPKPTGRS